MNNNYWSIRKQQLKDLAELVNKEEGPWVVMGDLNCSLWCPDYKTFQKETGLKNARKGFGICASWPSGNSPLKIPIDHCLVSPQIKVKSVKLGPEVYSDHLPLIVEIVP